MNFWRCSQERKPDSLIPGFVFVSMITRGVCVSLSFAATRVIPSIWAWHSPDLL